ncbi:MAG: methyltransferase, TIGR04325 family [Candidatus Heimdallarchaeota archaeon]|nr:methyltransferase, TIGR04325 family [Candidatus Heimdallarchaeota archaeon]
MTFISFLKNWILPPKFYGILTDFKRKEKTYRTINEALEHCQGYNFNDLVDIIDRKSHDYFERMENNEIIPFPSYRMQIIFFIHKLSSQNSSEALQILDIGGQLGVLYHELMSINKEISVKWYILEAQELNTIGSEKYENDDLKFIQSLNEIKDIKFDVVIAANSLQYLENPELMLSDIFAMRANYIYLTRFPIINKTKENVIVIQKSKLKHNGPGNLVIDNDSEITYPMHILSGEKMVEFINKFDEYSILYQVNESGHMYKYNGELIQGTTIILKKNT